MQPGSHDCLRLQEIIETLNDESLNCTWLNSIFLVSRLILLKTTIQNKTKAILY